LKYKLGSGNLITCKISTKAASHIQCPKGWFCFGLYKNQTAHFSGLFLFYFTNVNIYKRKFMNYIEPRLLKGFRDYGPKEQTIRQQMVAKIQNVFERFGFLPMSTPVLEYKEILTGKYGEDEKLIYSFKDNGDRDVAMRYDLTVPLARFVAQNKQQIVYPFKRYQIAPVWRADNPQKGRLREFMQCDIDVIGSDSLLADVGVVACVCSALDEIGVDNYELRISNRGIFNTLSRAMHLDSVQSIEVVRAIDKVKKIGIDGVVKLLQEKQTLNRT
jgi:histidyl-tRNA synthetase